MRLINQIGWGASLLLAVLLSTQAFAAPAVQNIFSNGQPANADQVNDNFQELADRIDAVPAGQQGPEGPEGPAGPQGPPGADFTQINFDPYRHNFDSKTFKVLGSNDEGQKGFFWQEVRTYDRTTTPGVLIDTRHLTDNNVVTQQFRKFYYTTGQGQDKVWTKREFYDLVDTSLLTSSNEFDPGLTVIKNNMVVGHIWSTPSISNNFTAIGNQQTEQTGISGRVETRVLLGQESVTANSVDYNNCLKILRMRLLTSGSTETIMWFCEGQGLVKEVSNGGIKELVSTTP